MEGNGTASGAIERGFADIERLYLGKHPDYLPCDTEYHDIQHVLDVTLAMARLMDGYERSRKVTRGSKHLHAYLPRLDLQLARAYEYAERHFNGQNLYPEEMQKNVRYAQAVCDAPNTDMLRRTPPSTLNKGVEPYPRDLVIR